MYSQHELGGAELASSSEYSIVLAANLSFLSSFRDFLSLVYVREEELSLLSMGWYGVLNVLYVFLSNFAFLFFSFFFVDVIEFIIFVNI